MALTPLTMPAYLMGKMGNCPGPRAQGAPNLLKGLLKIQEKGGKKKKKKVKEQKRGKKCKKEIK